MDERHDDLRRDAIPVDAAASIIVGRSPSRSWLRTASARRGATDRARPRGRGPLSGAGGHRDADLRAAVPPAGPTQFGFIANPGLRPEVGKNKELGLNLRFDDLLTKGDAFRGKANYFRNDLTNFIELTVVGALPPCPAVGPGAFCFQYINLPSARIEGYEFETMYDTGYMFFGLAGMPHPRP